MISLGRGSWWLRERAAPDWDLWTIHIEGSARSHLDAYAEAEFRGTVNGEGLSGGCVDTWGRSASAPSPTPLLRPILTSLLTRETLRTYPYPDSARLYSAFHVGNDGLLWVQLFSPPGPSSVTWLGFAPSGSLTTVMDLPRAARLLDIGDGYALVRVRDELGVESVVLYGVRERRESR